MCLRQFYLEKTIRMHRETASEMASLPLSQNNPERERNSYKGKYARTGKFLKLFVHKKHNKLHVSS